MASGAQSTPALQRWRNFCEQWRHSYLIMAAVFLVIWRASMLPIAKLEHTRFMGVLHPFDVFLLMKMLKLMWFPPLVAIGLYAASFLISRLNTPIATAVTAIGSSAILACVLLCALMHISLSAEGRVPNSLAGPPWPTNVTKDPRKFIHVAWIRSEFKFADRARSVLGKAGIHCSIEGSLEYSVAVPPEQTMQAAQILKDDGKIQNYNVRTQ